MSTPAATHPGSSTAAPSRPNDRRASATHLSENTLWQPFLGWRGMKIQAAYPGAGPVHTRSQVINIPLPPHKGALRPHCPHSAPKALAAQSCLICQPVLEGKFVFQTLKNQHLGWRQYSGNWYNLILPHILISFPLLTVHTHDCCPAQYFNLELQFLKTSVKYFCYIKVPCFEEPMGVEKVSLEMSLNYNFNLFALCDKYIWLY